MKLILTFLTVVLILSACGPFICTSREYIRDRAWAPLFCNVVLAVAFTLCAIIMVEILLKMP